MACDRQSTGNPNADVQMKRCSTILVMGAMQMQRTEVCQP